LDRLGETLLEKETLALPDIVECLGPRPYPLKSTVLEYLQELKERKIEEEKTKEQLDAEAAQKAGDQKPP
jgi:hypothetical protein